MSTTALQAAKSKALAELDGYTFRTAAGILGKLLELNGVGTTTALQALRELEADEKIKVERKDGRAIRYALAIPTDEELNGSTEAAKVAAEVAV